MEKNYILVKVNSVNALVSGLMSRILCGRACGGVCWMGFCTAKGVKG